MGVQHQGAVRFGPPLGVNVALLIYGVNLLINVDQLAIAARTPGPWLAPPQVPSRLSPVPPTKNGPPQSVYEQACAMYSLAIQIELPSTAAAP